MWQTFCDSANIAAVPPPRHVSYRSAQVLYVGIALGVA